MIPVGLVALCLAIAALACQDRAGPPAEGGAAAQSAAAADRAAGSDLDPEQVFAAFRDAVERRDGQALFELMDPDLCAREGVTLEAMQGLLSGPSLPDGWDTFLQQQVVGVETRADSAILAVQLADGSPAPAFRLRRVDGRWRVVGQKP